MFGMPITTQQEKKKFNNIWVGIFREESIKAVTKSHSNRHTESGSVRFEEDEARKNSRVEKGRSGWLSFFSPPHILVLFFLIFYYFQ